MTDAFKSIETEVSVAKYLNSGSYEAQHYQQMNAANQSEEQALDPSKEKTPK